MQIQVKSAKETTYPNLGRYFLAELSCGAHEIVVEVAPEYVRVIVMNASHRAWRKLGKQFKDMAAAMANYKTPEIRAMLAEVATLDKVQRAAGELLQ